MADLAVELAACLARAITLFNLLFEICNCPHPFFLINSTSIWIFMLSPTTASPVLSAWL